MFGQAPNPKDHETKKYIYERDSAYFILDLNVGVKIINKDTYNVNILWMYIDFKQLPSTEFK